MSTANASNDSLLLQCILDSLSMSIISTDMNGLITHFSQGAEQLLGYRADEVVGLFTPAHFHDMEEVLARTRELSQEEHQNIAPGFETFVYLARQGRADTREWTYIRKDGSRVLASLTVTQVCDRSGTPVGFVGVAQDISAHVKAEKEQARLQKKVEAQMEELQRINAELTQFAYVASHDLRAPLRGVKQLADWIMTDLGETASEEVKEQLRLLASRVQRMDKLLVDLLDYSRAGKLEGELVETDLAALARDVFEMSSAKPGFTLQLDENLPVFHTLSVPLEQVLRNLVSNALKHHDNESGVVHIAARPHDEWLEISVADDGPGIPPALHEKAFSMFQTLKPRDAVEGSGMGLALVRRIVHGLGGNVYIRAHGSRGTTVIFTWPGEGLLRSKLNERSAT